MKQSDSRQNNGKGRLLTRRVFVAQLASAGAAVGSLLAGCAGQPNAPLSDASSEADFSQSPDDHLKSSSAEANSEDATRSSAGSEAAVKSPDKHIARIVLVSDMHIDAGFEPSIGHAQAAFAAFAHFDPKPDAIVINGDITNHGQFEEYDFAATLASEAGLEFPSSFICVMGNHEQRGYYDETTHDAFQAQRDLFIERCGVERLYYDVDVCGVHVIVLGPDADPQSWKTINMSAEQLEWLDAQLASDAKTGRLAFVFSHQPISETVIHTYEGEYAFGSLESSEELRAVVAKYPEAMVVTAHTHSPADFFRPNDKGPLYISDSAVAYLRHDPYTDWTDGGDNYSCGILADVYGNRVEFLSWDFVQGAPDEAGGFTLETA